MPQETNGNFPVTHNLHVPEAGVADEYTEFLDEG